VEILRRYQDAIDVMIVEKDKGQADAINRGLRLARGNILAYLNADDCYASPHTISTVVQYFLANPEVDVIYGGRYQIDEQGGFLENYPYRQFSAEVLYRADYIPQEATFWTRRIYARTGSRIDTSFNFALDYELWLRFLKAGARFLSVPDVFGLFRTYEEQKTKALWESVGVPEIARLHAQYLGQAISARHDGLLLRVPHRGASHSAERGLPLIPAILGDSREAPRPDAEGGQTGCLGLRCPGSEPIPAAQRAPASRSGCLMVQSAAQGGNEAMEAISTGRPGLLPEPAAGPAAPPAPFARLGLVPPPVGSFCPFPPWA